MAFDQKRLTAGFLDNTLNWDAMCLLNPKINFIKPKQVHGNTIHTVTEKNLQTFLVTPPEGDGLVTRLWGTGLVVQTADCMPVIAIDFESEVLGICHIGWKGLVNHAAIEFMKALLASGAKTSQLVFSVGPHISANSFEVGKDVAKQIKESIDPSKLGSLPNHKDPTKEYLSMKDILALQLASVSVKRTQISVNNACTFKDAKYFSYRRDKAASGGRNISFIYAKVPLY